MRYLLICLTIWLGAPAAAQGQFAPVVRVGDQVVTGYELSQRVLFNRLLGAPGDVRALSIDQLIDDRIRLAEAARLGIDVPPEAIDAGMEEFAGRANLEAGEFVSILRQAGVDEATFRAFVKAGVAWREAVRARFADRAEVSDAEIDRAVSEGAAPGEGTRLLLSEIVIPAPTATARDTALARARQVAALGDSDAFARAARAYSAAGSAARGGELGWLPAEALPEEVRAAVLAAPEGTITPPVAVPGAIALFLVREVAEPGPAAGAVDYAAFYIPGGRSPAALAEAARVRARLQTCEDLYPVARGLPPERLERATVPQGRLPADVAGELALLDPGEVSTRLTRADGQTLVLLMLCDRTGAVDPQTVDRAAVANRIRNERLGRIAAGYLEELRAETRIVRL